MRFLIDECLSVDLVTVAGESGYEARHVAHVGRAGWKDGCAAAGAGGSNAGRTSVGAWLAGSGDVGFGRRVGGVSSVLMSVPPGRFVNGLITSIGAVRSHMLKRLHHSYRSADSRFRARTLD